MKEYLVETSITTVSGTGREQMVAKSRETIDANSPYYGTAAIGAWVCHEIIKDTLCDHEDLESSDGAVWCADCGKDLTLEHEQDMDYAYEDLADSLAKEML